LAVGNEDEFSNTILVDDEMNHSVAWQPLDDNSLWAFLGAITKNKTMNKTIGIALLAAGIALIIFGINASESFGSEVSRFFTCKPTDKSMWLLVGGIAATVVGAVAVLRPSSKAWVSRDAKGLGAALF
jgi:hypothetical protein